MKKIDSRLLSNTFRALGFLLPFLTIYTIFIIWPITQGVYVSLHRWGLMGRIRFVGLANYVNFLSDRHFWEALLNTTWFVLFAVPSVIIAALVLALLANRTSGCKKLFRVCFYVPAVLSVSVISFMAIFLYSPHTGFVNSLFQSLRITPPGVQIMFLIRIPWIWAVVVLTTVWWTTGFSMMLYISAMQDIPETVYEAAEIDGAKYLTIFTRIMIPLSKTVLVTVSIFAFMGSWNNYLWPLLCAIGRNMFTLPVGIPTLINTYSLDYVIPCTANMVASIPAIIMFLIFERHITRGIALSGIKG